MSTSVDELVSALDDEARSRLSRYRELSQQADRSDLPQPARFFRALVAIETAKHELYRRRLASLADPARSNEYYVCPECGYAYGAEPDKCPVCETAGAEFERVG